MIPPRHKLLGRGKSGYSYLSEHQGRPAVLKQIHHEPCAYYQFGDKLADELVAYERLRSIGIPVPALLDYNKEQEWLLKEYYPGPTAAECIAHNELDECYVAHLFALARTAQAAGLNIDFFPTNFVLNHRQLMYIDYEINPWQKEWSLAEWGIFYWANNEGMRLFLETGQHRAINQDENSGIPLKEAYIGRTNRWINQFAFP